MPTVLTREKDNKYDSKKTDVSSVNSNDAVNNNSKACTNTMRLPPGGNKDNSEIIQLMDVYLKEWCHRESSLLKQIRFFYIIAFCIMFLPNVHPLDFSLPINIPAIVFVIIGIIFSWLSYLISQKYTKRLYIVSKKYRELIDILPEEYRQEKDDGKVIDKICLVVSILQSLVGIFYIGLIIFDYLQI